MSDPTRPAGPAAPGSASPPDRESVLRALDSVRTPDGHSLVAAGMIQGLVLRDGAVGFAIEVPPETAPAMEPVREAAEHAVRALPGVTAVTAVLTAHREGPGTSAPPQNPARRKPGGTRPQADQRAHARHSAAPRNGPLELPGVGAIIAVASGKGGVGKSTLAVNLALGLRALGLRVGLLDADVYGPSIPRMLGLSQKPETGAGNKLIPLEAYGLKAMSIGLIVDEDTPMIWRGPMVQSAISQMLADVAWAPLDVLVVDMPPGTGDAQLTLAQRVPLSGAVIVSTPQEIALIDARKAVAMFEKTRVPILGMVENMAWFELPDGTRTHVFGEGGARRTAERLGVPFLGEVPLIPEIREGGDTGRPVAADPGSPAGQVFQDIARKVMESLEGTPRKPAPRIVVED